MTELELDTLPKRKAARGAVVYIVMVIFHILPVCLSPLLKVCAKLAKQDEAAKDSRSHFSSAIHIPFTFCSQNAPTSISISGLGGVKEWKKKMLYRTFFRRFSASAGRFRPSFSLLDRLFPVTLRAKRTAMQAPRHTSMRGKPLHSVANTVNWYCRQS